MLDVLAITTPIFLLIALGYVAVMGGVVTREHVQGIGRLVVNFALPALIVRSLSQHPLPEMFNAHYLLAYGLGSLAMLAFGLALARFQRRQLTHGAIMAMGMGTANSGFIGYPIAAMVIGPKAGIALALCMLIENMVMIPLSLALAEAGRQQGLSVSRTIMTTLQRLVRNPVILSIIVGALISLSGMDIPTPLYKALDMLANASAPAALFVIGGTLYGLKVQGMYRDVGQITLAKLVLHPLLVLLGFQLFPVADTTLMMGALIIASAPMLSIYPIFGVRFSMDGLCAAALLAASVVSFFTISTVLWLLPSSGA
ncbi:transporter [Kushneria pakistanensis]|uniref:Transporter n=1 Tax=Kushneria pakistanensis TaxID=1508770 RepID=A0ABQ3FMX2_9GAMM|nr:AEC family transporter [Kushneria pakistanensis]GHC29612.1 transporter [Kushneria pakistanensis]